VRTICPPIFGTVLGTEDFCAWRLKHESMIVRTTYKIEGTEPLSKILKPAEGGSYFDRLRILRPD
jgi:hypothetical protein